MSTRECPECGAEMEWQQDEPDVGIVGGWQCLQCGYTEQADAPDEL